MNTDDFAKFLAAWFATGKLARTAGELMPLAEAAGLELAGETLRGKQIALGQWLTLQVNSPVIHDGTEYRVTKEFSWGRTWYTIHAHPCRSDDRR